MSDGFVKDSASYRRVHVYTKSFERYKLEKERRHRVRVLAARGYTQKQIAQELRVSVRTVKRDWDKVRSYAKADVKRRLRREFERSYPGLGFDEAVARLKHDVKVYDEKARAGKAGVAVPGGRRGQPSELVVNLYLDELMADGFPLVRVFPAHHMQFSGNFSLRIIASKAGVRRELICLEVSRSTPYFR